MNINCSDVKNCYSLSTQIIHDWWWANPVNGRDSLMQSGCQGNL